MLLIELWSWNKEKFLFETIVHGLLTNLYIRSRRSQTVFYCKYPLIDYLDSIKEKNREIVYCVDKKGTLFIPEEQTKKDTTDIDQYEEELKVRNYQKDVKKSDSKKQLHIFYCIL